MQFTELISYIMLSFSCLYVHIVELTDSLTYLYSYIYFDQSLTWTIVLLVLPHC